MRRGPQLSNRLQNSPRGGKWASKFEDKPTGKKAAVRPKKFLGQHFLNDLAIAERIASLVDDNMAHVVEIGPGTGILTRFLFERFSSRLKCMEIDEEAIQYLHKQKWAEGLDIWKGDYLETIDSDWLLFGGQKQALIGNFPYNISTQIVFKILEAGLRIDQFAGMFQKEVALRLCADEGNKDYGITSVLLQAYYTCNFEFTVNEHSFDPPPRVKSGVIQCRLRENMPNCKYESLKVVVKTAFSQRRKTLGNSLKPLTSARENFFIPEDWVTKRAEQLSVADYIYLAKIWESTAT